MEKKGLKKSSIPSVSKILITQPRPDSEKSPYFELERKFGVSITFQPFTRIEGVSAKEFRKQKIEIAEFSAVIFTSRHSIDHFFRICGELRVNVSQDTKYFCISESVALYLQKFILYRKRKVFFGADGTNKSLFDVLNKHKSGESFLFPCSEPIGNDIIGWLDANNCRYSLPVIYKTVNNDIRELINEGAFDIICFFTPKSVKCLFENIPLYKQEKTVIGAFGINTFKYVLDAGMQLTIKAPEPQLPSMASAIEHFLSSNKKPKK